MILGRVVTGFGGAGMVALVSVIITGKECPSWLVIGMLMIAL